MPRPRRCRRVFGPPSCRLFKPAGVPARSLREETITVDELEAIRLADFEGLYQEEAAGQMNVSRQTFGRIIESAHRKVARALVEGNILRIEGGEIEMAETRIFTCVDCRYTWPLPFGTGRPGECPACLSQNIHRSEGGPGAFGRGHGRHRRGWQRF